MIGVSEVCNLVTRVIEVFETVWNWVCREVVERIIDWVERIVEYVAYILRWVCWAIGWLTRGPALLLCALGYRPKRFLHVCIRVLMDTEGTPAVEWDKVERDLEQARAIFRRCSIELVVNDRERIEKPDFLDGTTCDFSGMFTDFFTWFARNECTSCSTVTVYYVRSIPGAIGCAYPGSNWVTVATGGDGRTMVQEIGHLCDLWGHSEDPNNVMTDQSGGTADQITGSQCCMIRTSRFTLASRCPSLGPIGVRRESVRGEPHGQEVLRSQAFQSLHNKEPGSQPLQVSRVAQAAIAVIAVICLGRVGYGGGGDRC